MSETFQSDLLTDQYQRALWPAASPNSATLWRHLDDISYVKKCNLNLQDRNIKQQIKKTLLCTVKKKEVNYALSLSYVAL